MIDQIIEEYKKSNHFGELLNMDLESYEEGEVLYKMKIQTKHLATPIAAHGGAVAALMDALLGVTALTVASKSKCVVSTVEFKLNFLKPVILGDTLHGTAKILAQGKRLIIVEGEITNQDGSLVSKGQGTFNAYPKEKAGL
ncbi:MAG: PaaI family thioesterase [Crocinitomicaceae bacterium]|nr:PaaI family thioesterase [Crocinitomicaceae bacterium]